MTISHNCTDVTATSTLIATFLANPTVYTLEVIHSLNGVEQETYTVLVGDITVDTIDLDFANFSLAEWTTSVYGVKLVLTDSRDGSLQYEEICFFQDCSDLLCTVHAYQINNPTSKVRNLYDALIDMEDCGDCDCTNMNKAYALLIGLLNSTSSTESDCGC